MPAAPRPFNAAPHDRASLRRDREPVLAPAAPPPARRLPGPDYWLREDTLVEPPARSRHLPEEPVAGTVDGASRAGRRGLRWILWLTVALLVPALAAWALSQPEPWRRFDAITTSGAVSTVVVPVTPAVPTGAGTEAPVPPAAEPPPSQARDGRTAPERLAAARSVPRNARCALLIRTAQLGAPMEVTDLAYLTRACAPD